METLDKEERHKHDHESRIELVPKDSHGQESLRYGKPYPLAQMRLFNGPQIAEKDLLHSEAEQDCEEDAHVCEDHKAGIALREIDACRVEIRPLLERREDNGPR